MEILIYMEIIIQIIKMEVLINMRTSDFKIEIGTRFQDDKRDITITDRKKNGKYKIYQYHCNKCGFYCGEHYSIKDKKYKKSTYVREDHLLASGVGCSCCCKPTRIIVEGINDIPTTAPWMIKYFQGGDKEAKLYTYNSGKKIKPICPNCGQIKDKYIKIFDIYNNESIGCSCSDSISYGEKIISNLLKQLKIEFKIQPSKKIFKWCNNYRYDFYFELNDEDYILEVNGRQHYEQSGWEKGKSLVDEQENDKLKKELALANGIKPKNYIIIDCRESTLEFIKQNILESRLNELFNLSNIDWMKCGEFASCSLVKIACEYKKNNPDWTATQIGKSMGYCQRTIIDWLKQGSEIWSWINYNAKEEQIKNGKRLGNLKKGVINYV